MTDSANKLKIKDFFIDGLEDIYDAEKKFMKCFAALGIAAVNEELQNALTAHNAVTEKHLTHLEGILKEFGRNADGGTCWIVSSLSDKASETIRRIETGTPLRDVAIVSLAQVIQHYKIACYGNLAPLAIAMKHWDPAALIEGYLNEEKETAGYLTVIARDFINPAAAEGYHASI